jgi:CBS domain-containing protein
MSRSLQLIRKTTPIEPEIEWCFVSLGSMARYEQILPTDQDNALIYRIAGDTISTKCKDSMLRFGRRVNKWLVELGFESCPANVMSGNPEWCKPLDEWKNTFEKWFITPTPKNVMNTTIFFDMRAIYGSIHLVNDLKTYWGHLLQKHPDFLSYLAADALKSPAPIGFFRHFLVEKNGTHKDQFDLKARSLMPIVDAARLFALSLGITYETSTTERLDAICVHYENEPDKVDLFSALKKAYINLLSFRAQAAAKNDDSGRFINIEKLDRYDRQILKQCFRPVSELSQWIEQKFDTALLNR